MKFIFKTLSMNSTTYDGPSGERYIIYRGKPFEVNKPEDIEFFKSNNRFEEVGVFTKIEAQDDIDVKLKKELSKIRGLKSVDKIVELYISMDNIVKEVEQGFDINPAIPIKERKILKKYIEKKNIR